MSEEVLAKQTETDVFEKQKGFVVGRKRKLEDACTHEEDACTSNAEKKEEDACTSKAKKEEKKEQEQTQMSDSSIFNWFSEAQWHAMMLRSTPVLEIFDSLVDFDMADKHTLEMLKSPWKVVLSKSKHAGEGLPRRYLFAPQPDLFAHEYKKSANPDHWWSELLSRGFVEESPDVLRDRRFIVKSHMIGTFSFIGDSRLARLRIDDFYYPSFWLEVSIDMQSRRVLSVKGRHAEATSFHISQRMRWPSIEWDLIGVSKRPMLRARISNENVLSVWDEESEHVAFEIVCDLSKFFKLVQKKEN